jgi:hypothetical protein
LGENAILDYSALVGVVELERRRQDMQPRLSESIDPIEDLLIENPKKLQERG